MQASHNLSVVNIEIEDYDTFIGEFNFWAEDRCHDETYIVKGLTRGRYTIFFEDERDAVAFKLFWS